MLPDAPDRGARRWPWSATSIRGLELALEDVENAKYRSQPLLEEEEAPDGCIFATAP